MKRLALLFAGALCSFAQNAAVEPSRNPQEHMLRWLDRAAQAQLDRRESEIRKIQAIPDAERRKEYVKAKILESMGGLPDYKGPLNPKITGTINHGNYVIEKVIFESLPQVYITANLYRPSQSGRYPAVLFPLGHWEEGKPAVQELAGNLAMKGFVVLVYDPIGQGERLQSYDARLGKSLAGGAVDQHFMAGAQSILVGQSFARYRVFDGMRAIDYLVSRPEVDAEKIGCTGCSGGGTLTTFISALDSRVKVAAPACYMNSFRVLFSGTVGDSEQSLPNFLSSGLDQTDFVELFAPKPWLISSTIDDFFKLEGARLVYEEGRRWYRIYGAEDKIKWAIGPGGHGTPLEVREAIYEWFIRWLKDGKGDPREQKVEVLPELQLRATKSGQVATELKSRDIYEVIREAYKSGKRAGSQAELLEYVRKLAAPATEITPAARVLGETRTADLITQQVAFEVEPGLELRGTLLIPRTAGKKQGALTVESNDKPSATAMRLATAGNVVLALLPRDMPFHSSDYRMHGDWSAATRAWLIGRNLPGMRALDIRRGVDVLAARADVDASDIKAAACEVGGVWLLMAAAIDSRIKGVWLDKTPYSLRAALNNPIHRSLHEAAMPGFVLRWDLQDLVKAIAPRTVIWTDPTDWMGTVVPVPGAFEYRPWEGPDEPYIKALLQ